MSNIQETFTVDVIQELKAITANMKSHYDNNPSTQFPQKVSEQIKKIKKLEIN